MRNEFHIEEDRLQEAADRMGWNVDDLRKLTIAFGIFDSGAPGEAVIILDWNDKIMGGVLKAITEALLRDKEYHEADRQTLMETMLLIGLYVGSEYMRAEAPHRVNREK